MVPPDYRDRNVAILGCGYVGLTLAAVMADVGFDVVGAEIRDDVLARLGRGEPQFHEPWPAGHAAAIGPKGKYTVHQAPPERVQCARVYHYGWHPPR